MGTMMTQARHGSSTLFPGSVVDPDDTLRLRSAGERQSERNGPWRPPLEVYETATELVVRVEIAGLAIGAVEVLIDRDELVVRGERLVAPCAVPRMFHESRIRYGPFLAAVSLPFPVDERAANAEYADGLLLVTLPRLAPTKIGMRNQTAPIGIQGGEQ